MKSFFILFFSLSSISFAHIDQGTWKGKINDNANCFMDVAETFFIDNVKHPLNERIKIKVGNTEYLVKHPYKIDINSGDITFDHDLFEDVVPTPTGAYAIQLKMIHTETFEGPKSLIVMEHDWRNGIKEVISCQNLELVYKK